MIVMYVHMVLLKNNVVIAQLLQVDTRSNDTRCSMYMLSNDSIFQSQIHSIEKHSCLTLNKNVRLVSID